MNETPMAPKPNSAARTSILKLRGNFKHTVDIMNSLPTLS